MLASDPKHSLFFVGERLKYFRYELKNFVLIYCNTLFSKLFKKTGIPDGSLPPADTVTDNPAQKKWLVTTVAGNGTASFVNGNALSATFHFPEDVAVGLDGAIYVTDVANFCIRKIFQGQVSTFAGGTGFDVINADWNDGAI